MFGRVLNALPGNFRNNHPKVHVRSSRSQMFVKIDVLKNFAIFTGIDLC